VTRDFEHRLYAKGRQYLTRKEEQSPLSESSWHVVWEELYSAVENEIIKPFVTLKASVNLVRSISEFSTSSGGGFEYIIKTSRGGGIGLSG
jgi:hypothetical protein